MLTEDQLKGPLTIHMIEGLRAALQMKGGTFRFAEFQETESDHASFDPVDFDQIYTRALIGNEELPFLHKGIDKAILKTNTENLFLLPAGRLAPGHPVYLLHRKLLGKGYGFSGHPAFLAVMKDR